MTMDRLRPEERQAFEEIITSPARLQRLVKGAPRAGSARKFGVADVTPRMMLVFADPPRRIRLVERFDKQTIDEMGIKLSPADPEEAAQQPGR
jgi:hypothetical protein